MSHLPDAMSAAAYFLTLTLLLLAYPCAEQVRSGGAPASLHPNADPVARRINALLRLDSANRAGQPAWPLQSRAEVLRLYGSAPAAQWTRPGGRLAPAAETALGLLSNAPAYGLQPGYYGTALLRALRDSLAASSADSVQAARQARFDVYLSDAVLTLMRDLHRGRLHPYTPSPQEQTTGRAFRAADQLRLALTADSVAATVLACQPRHRAYRQLQQALARWLQGPDSTGQTDARRQAQYAQAALNLERWRWQAIPDSEYVLINIPAFELLVVRADSVVRRHRVIVGKPPTPTPTLRSRITHFTLAPDWHVPRSIATKEILPRLQADPGYLARNGYTLYSPAGAMLDPFRINWAAVTPQHFAYVIRQSAGCDNALGNIVFRFPNPYSVYLHDTPMRQYFDQPQRAFSHGCIRLEQPLQLAAYLLRREGRAVHLPDEAACARQPRPRHVPLRRPMPLHVCYATCAAERGRLRFYPDIYHRDVALRRAMFDRAADTIKTLTNSALNHDIGH
jgi:L,D-transpeptidase YcbB